MYARSKPLAVGILGYEIPLNPKALGRGAVRDLLGDYTEPR